MAALNPFEIFGLAPKFDLDEDQLQKKYLEVQRKVHPDRFASASDAEKRVAEQWAALINDAYHKLNDPVERGKLLCSMKGVVVDGERSGTLDETFLFDQRSQMRKRPLTVQSWIGLKRKLSPRGRI